MKNNKKLASFAYLLPHEQSNFRDNQAPFIIQNAIRRRR